MRSIAVLFSPLLFLTWCGTALAQQAAECPACRASIAYGRCPMTVIEHPPKDHIAFTGKVAAVKPINCGMQIRVNVTRSSTRGLPSTIDVDVGPCLFWSGSIGDAISGVIADGANKPGPYTAQTCTPGPVH